MGKFISIDGDPVLTDKNSSINLWYTGTTLKILKQYRYLENNFVNMNNPVIKKEQNLFQVYPIIKRRQNINKEIKLFFYGEYFFSTRKF